MAKQGMFDIEKTINERKGIAVEVAEKGLVDAESGELFEFEKIFAPYVGKEISFSIKVTTTIEDVADFETTIMDDDE